MKQVYATECTEYERDELGCSQRPDGITIGESLEKVNAHIKEESTGSPDYCWRYSTPIALFVDEKQWKALLKTSKTGLVHVKKLPDGFYKQIGGTQVKSIDWSSF